MGLLTRALWQTAHIQSATLLLFLSSALTVPELRGGETRKEDAGYFFKVIGAKDCAFDEQRQRLYVTNEKQIVVLDTKERKVVKTIDLLGGVRACDTSPDGKYLAVAPLKGQFLYWIQLDDLEISQVRFKADPGETGVYDLRVGADNTVLFSMTFDGSGGVSLRTFDPKTNAVAKVGKVNMDSVITASGDRRYAAVAEGNISSGPLQLYDFQEHKLKKVANLNCFHYEIACARGARYFARPYAKGCDLLDENGGRLGTLEGKPVICAAFHPKDDRLFVMRHGETNIQEYQIQGQKMAHAYPLDKALVITGDVSDRIIANLQPVGRDLVIANFSRLKIVHYRTFQSGRVRVSDNGEKLFAVVSNGVYMFSVINPGTPENGKTPKIKVIEAK